MSYLSQAQDPKRRATAVTGTIAVHVALGIAIVTGLTITGFTPEDTYNPTFNFQPEEEPEPEPTPAPAPQQQSVITSPVPPIDLQPRDPVVDPVLPDLLTEEVVVIPRPDPIVSTDPPRPTFTPRRARPSNDSNRWVTTNDYPPNPLRNGVEGTSGYRLVVGTNGRVASCEITRPSGNIQLDSAACRHIALRARFEAATDETGAKVVGTYAGTVKWEIPD